MEPSIRDRSWFGRPAQEVARDLLGALLRTERADGTVVLRITEVEAYGGTDDPVSHAARGRTARNSSMYLAGGHLYVYRHLGLHHCVNIVTGPPDVPGAVLLRAGEVVEGRDLARRRRLAAGVVRRDVDLARGPGRLAVALGIAADHDGRDLVPVARPRNEVREVSLLVPDERLPSRAGPRVGVAQVGRDDERFGWRFWLADEPSVSPDRGAARPRPSERRPAVTREPTSTAD